MRAAAAPAARATRAHKECCARCARADTRAQPACRYAPHAVPRHAAAAPCRCGARSATNAAGMRAMPVLCTKAPRAIIDYSSKAKKARVIDACHQHNKNILRYMRAACFHCHHAAQHARHAMSACTKLRKVTPLSFGRRQRCGSAGRYRQEAGGGEVCRRQAGVQDMRVQAGRRGIPCLPAA